MDQTRILSTAFVTPPFSETTKDTIPYVRGWLSNEDKRLQDKAAKIFEFSNIQRRYSIMSIQDVFNETSFEAKNDYFIEAMKGLCEQAVQQALDKGGMKASELDGIISVSCTGFMIPSMDAYLINQLGMRQDVFRLPVTEMGCAGGVAGMNYADQFIRSNPDKKLALVAFESPTTTFQHNDHSMTNIVSAALFGDGVACVIFGSNGASGTNKPKVVDTAMHHFYHEESMMGFHLRNTGFQMVLDVEVPEKIEDQLDDFILPFLARNQVEMEDIDYLIFHPGGKKIISLIEKKFSGMEKKLDATKEILYHYGNMSSATVLYVLDHCLKDNPTPGSTGLMLSFGPGFTAQLVLLKWD